MNKKIYSTIILLLGFLMLTCKVQAINNNTFDIKLTSTKETLKPGEEISILMEVININMEDGINVIEGKLNYSREIFEDVKQADIQTFNNFEIAYNDENTDENGKFLILNLDKGINRDTNILSFKLKVKENIVIKENTAINVENITSNDEIDLINIGTKQIELKPELILEQQEPVIEKENIKVDILPKTGESIILEIIFVCTIIVIAVLIGYKINKKKNKYNK